MNLPKTKTCSVEGCDNKKAAFNLCTTHYRRYRLYGDPLKLGRAKTNGPCEVDGCKTKAKTKGLCQTHYMRTVRGKSLLNPVHKKKSIEVCTQRGCDRPHLCRGFCKLHYERMRINGDPRIIRRTKANSIEEIKWRTYNGYVYGAYKGKKLMQHRFVWEQHHGRALQPFENIHHINGRRDDNRIENLELWTKAQPCGQRPEDLVAWVMDNYPELIQQHMKGKTNDKPARARQTRTGTNDKRGSTKRPAASRRPAQRAGRSR